MSRSFGGLGGQAALALAAVLALATDAGPVCGQSPDTTPASPPVITPRSRGELFGDGEQIGRDLENIRLQPEFRRLRKAQSVESTPQSDWDWPQWLKDFGNWLKGLFNSTGNAFSGLGIVFQLLAYALLAAIAAAIIWLLVRAFRNYQESQTLRQRRRRTPEEGEADAPPGDLPADEYLKRAGELAGQGLYREAIAQLILGAMSRTERGGLIRFRRGLTHRDYLRALRGRGTPHQAFQQIVAIYEPICFGRRDADMHHYLTSLDGYKTGFLQPLAANPSPARPAAGAVAASPQGAA